MSTSDEPPIPAWKSFLSVLAGLAIVAAAVVGAIAISDAISDPSTGNSPAPAVSR